ncbi:MAG TPA: TonB-dependent receptor, partial [Candidatus Manganitrophaceae bacterium]|nr:TonB-dependent receptor [Candidatus Manganitrophaceae bacterium]
MVTATKTEVPLAQAASSVTIIDRKTIEEKHLITVGDALREAPGLDLVQTGGPGGTTSAFLRGGNSTHTLVLIDGVEMTDATTGAFDLADLTTENIDRIEIVRGPQSTLYGSNAIGGVIQIITKKGSGPPTPSISFEAGSFKTFRETVGFSGGTRRFDYSLSAARVDTDGFSRADAKNGNTERDGYGNSSFSARLGFNFTEKSRLEWTARYLLARTELDGFGPCHPADPTDFSFCPVDDPNFVQYSRTFVNALNLTTPVTDRWNQNLRLSFKSDELRGRDPDTVFNNYNIDNSGERLDWRHDLTIAPSDLLTLGYEYQTQKGKVDEGFDERLINHAFFAFNQFRPMPFILNLGIRHDDNNRFGNETTYKTEIAYLFETGAKIRGAYGTGFRGPTFNDLFFPGASNPNLRPEKSRSWEAGIDQEFETGNSRLSATYFQNRVKDLILFVSDPVTFEGRPENVARAKTQGTEVELSTRPFQALILRASCTLMHAEDEESGTELPRRPRKKAAGTVTLLPMDGLRLDLDFRYVGRRFNDPGNESPMPAYTVANLAATYDLTKKTQLFARVENLFDRQYEEVSGYGTAGFSAFGGVK